MIDVCLKIGQTLHLRGGRYEARSARGAQDFVQDMRAFMMTNAPSRGSTLRYGRLLAFLAMATVLMVAAPATWAATAPAAVPGAGAGDPYNAVVPVPDTTTAERGKAFAQALQQVLTRVAGHALPQTPDADQAASFVEQYRYQQAPPGAAQPYELDVHFAPDSVRYLLRNLMAAPASAPAETSGAGSGAPATGAAGIATGPTSTGMTSLWISGIRSGTDFADALHGLTSTLGVQDVAVSAADGDGMLAQVDSSLSTGQLVAALQGSGHFTAAAPHAGATVSLAWQAVTHHDVPLAP